MEQNNTTIRKPVELGLEDFKQSLYQLLVVANRDMGISYTLMENIFADFHRQIQEASKEELKSLNENYQRAVAQAQAQQEESKVEVAEEKDEKPTKKEAK